MTRQPQDPDLEPREDESLDRLNARLWLLQRRRGHRATSDDVLLAWAAVRARPAARRYLDLGTGKGTVALLVLDALPQCVADGVEALPQSHELALRNARRNGLASRFSPRLGDLRSPAALPPDACYDLVGGAPPFVRPGAGVLPADPQRAAGRFELRGGVEDYAAAAARWLAPDGAAVLIMDGRGRERGLAALAQAGLACRRLTEVGPAPGCPATFWLFEAGHLPEPREPALRDGDRRAAAPPAPERLDLRERPGGPWTAAYARVRQRLALP